MILAGDIGGTKTNLALYEVRNKELLLKNEQQFASQEFSSFNEVVSTFKELHSWEHIDAACFGIAGPIIDGNCKTTNLPWDIKSSDLKNLLSTSNIKLLNDLEATAYGMLHLNEDEFVSLNPHAKISHNSNCAIIAAGTGLGEAMLYFDGKKHNPIGSEGGHCDFAPQTPQQDELLKFLRTKYPQHVSLERILSGPGVSALYDFLAYSNFAPEPQEMLNLKKDADKSALISECALKRKDPLCLETLRLFVEIYGAEASNLALKSLSVGGVFIGGGIAPKILPMMLNENFMKSFLAKGRFKEMLKNMPVKVSLNPKTALLGAAHFANSLARD